MKLNYGNLENIYFMKKCRGSKVIKTFDSTKFELKRGFKEKIRPLRNNIS